jgi:hypothetical protein
MTSLRDVVAEGGAMVPIAKIEFVVTQYPIPTALLLVMLLGLLLIGGLVLWLVLKRKRRSP